MSSTELQQKEERAKEALHKLGLEVADKWASGFQNRPTQQLILQKLIDPVVNHVLQSMFPWMVGTAVLFLVLLVCTVVTCVMVLRTTSSHDPLPSQIVHLLQTAAQSASASANILHSA
jgi:hypothetical protein